MAQLTGSGPGHGTNYAMVDNNNRLWTSPDNIVLDKVRVRGSGLVVIQKDYDRVINGNLYQAGSYVRGMPLDTSGGILLCTGSNDIHFRLDSRTDGDAIFNFYEGTHVSNSGVSLPIFNRSRHASILGSTIDSELWIDPIITNIGEIIHTAMYLGGSGVSSKHISATVASSDQGANWLLEAGSCYYMEFINQCGRDMNADFNIVLHEHGHV